MTHHRSTKLHPGFLSPVAALLILLAPGCGGSDPWSGISPPVRERALKEYKNVCSTCHGEQGMGNGPGAAELDPKPRTFTDVSWQQSVTDEHIKKTITLGGAAVGKSAGMPAHPQYKSQPEVLRGLVAKVRSFGVQQ